MLVEFAPALVLLVAALVVFGAGRIARKFGRAETLGYGVALCVIAIAIGVSPATSRVAWAGVSGDDRLLTYARIVGVTGMLFLAGTRFDFAQLKHRQGVVLRTAIAAAALFVAVLLLARLLGTDLGPTILLGAVVVASSLWVPGERRRSDQHDEHSINWQVAALAFTAFAFLVVYFFDVVSTSSRASLGLFAYIIVTTYEGVKLFVLFGFAYFICSRFLARTEGRVSTTRTTIGFVLITVLVFGLTVITTNQLPAFAWAFVAGALWRRTEIGIGFGERNRPAASAMLMSLTFVPLMLQSHGRDLIGLPTLIVFVVFLMTIKILVAWLSITQTTLAKQTALRLGVMLAFPGEIAIALLGFGITRWAVSGPVYFSVLGYALISTLLSPAIFSGGEMRAKRFIWPVASGCFILLLALQVNAQQFTYKVQQDRTIGHRDGELTISEKGIEYRAEKKENESRSWTYSNDIKLLEILSPTKIRIWTYKDRRLLLGGDESLTFKIIDGQIDQKTSDFLRERLPRPFVTSFIDEPGDAVAEIPVKHSHRFGGCEGTLTVYADRLSYQSQTGHDSRSWRWTDIRSVGRPDVYRLDIETFEPQAGASSRSFNFILKAQMPDKTYDLIWSRVYRPAPLIRAEVKTVENVEHYLDRLIARTAVAGDAASVIKEADTYRAQASQKLSSGQADEARALLRQAGEVIAAAAPDGDIKNEDPLLREYLRDLTKQLVALEPSARIPAPDYANPRVTAFLNYFQGKARSRLEVGRMRLASYRPMMTQVFHEEGIPEWLIAVGFVESTYNSSAHSPKEAHGIWQFVPGTGTRYGLRRTAWTDERSDPEKSTRAAARYLRDLYALFGDWQLALAAYNWGEGRVAHVIRQTGIRDFWILSDRGLVPGETANYVPSVLAASQLLLGKNNPLATTVLEE